MNITQQVPNFLGGISTKPDDQKELGEVREIINGYPDPTYGLVKRPGFNYVAELGNDTDYSGAHWFYYRYNAGETYIGAIKNGTITVWRTSTGNQVFQATGQTYLNNSGYNDFYVLPRQSQLVIVNKTTTVSTSGTTSGTFDAAHVANSVASLPAANTESGQYWKVENTSAAEDDYWVVSNGTSWVEAPKPGITAGLNSVSMPHVLTRTSENNFTFAQAAYSTRAVGDLDTNPDPSFVGKKINFAFYHNNRLGFLSEDNVILSQPNQFFNFYVNSAVVQSDADPVDLNCSSLKPVNLTAAKPVTQGVVLFSQQSQFILFSDTGVLTPAAATINLISDFEMDDVIHPVEMGTSFVFVNKTSAYVRVLTMETQGLGNNPLFIDIGKNVTQYIPNTVSKMFSDPQNSYIGMYDQDSNKAYFYRTYVENQQILMRSWYSWELPGNIQFLMSDSDTVFAVTKQTNKVALLKTQLNSIPTGAAVTAGVQVPSFDFRAFVNNSGITHDTTSDTTRIPIPFPKNTALTPVAVRQETAGTTFFQTPTQTTISGNDFFVIPGDVADQDWYVGYKFDFKVDLPIFYYRQQGLVDYSASLVLSRIKIAVGLSGLCEFKITPRNQDTMVIEGNPILLDRYTYDAVPIDDRNVYEIPIHQRNTNFDIQVFSDTPYIVSLNSVMWEGNYSPKYYRRT